MYIWIRQIWEMQRHFAKNHTNLMKYPLSEIEYTFMNVTNDLETEIL